MSGDDPKFAVRFESNAFYLATDSDAGEFRISTNLELDLSSQDLEFEVMPLLKADLHENAIQEVFLPWGKDDLRIGWMIPANALSSDEHDRAADPHFLKYAFVTIREVLLVHQRIIAAAVEQHQTQGVLDVHFADLFHDNVCFLAISKKRFPEGPSLEWLKPSLIGEGYLPHGSCDPSSVSWSPRPDFLGNKLKLGIVGAGISQPEVPIKMMTVAAGSSTSPVIQFFYLYQVIEFLMEVVLRTSIASIGSDIGRSIEAGRYQVLREHLEDFHASMSEKHRLKVLMERCVGSAKAIGELERAAGDFLATVDVTSKSGISSLYQVRNFVVHQVRRMPDEAEEQLRIVVYEFARFLPTVLAKFEADHSESLAMSPASDGAET